MRIAIPLAAVATALACSLATAPAHARARVFVASYGNDANPCTFGSPCKTFQQAVTVVDAGGEVTAIDSAGFGPINITKAVTVTSPDGVEAGIVPAAGGDAITIAAGASDAVSLRGLTIDGFGTGSIGLQINSGASVTIDHCVIRHFASGIVVSPSSGTTIFSMSDSFSLDNSSYGLLFHPTGSGSALGRLVRDELSRNKNGLFVVGDSTTAFAATKVVVSETSANDHKTNDGFSVSGGATLTLTRSISTGNFNGIAQYNGSNNQAGVLQSYGDNRFVGNVQLNAPDVVMLTGN